MVFAFPQRAHPYAHLSLSIEIHMREVAYFGPGELSKDIRHLTLFLWAVFRCLLFGSAAPATRLGSGFAAHGSFL